MFNSDNKALHGNLKGSQKGFKNPITPGNVLSSKMTFIYHDQIETKFKGR